MISLIQRLRIIIAFYMAFFILVILDLFFSVFSELHMKAYGDLKSIESYIFRFSPNLIMTFFYSLFFYSVRKQRVQVLKIMVILNSGLLAILGLWISLPFGWYLSIFTPVALLYRLLILMELNNFYAIYLIFSLLFFLLNTYFCILGWKINTFRQGK